MFIYGIAEAACVSELWNRMDLTRIRIRPSRNNPDPDSTAKENPRSDRQENPWSYLQEKTGYGPDRQDSPESGSVRQEKTGYGPDR